MDFDGATIPWTGGIRNIQPQVEYEDLFLDIAKAYNRIWHRRLIHKMNWLGYQLNIIQMVCSFLAGWQIWVHMSWSKSSQGPLLFNIYIADMPVPESVPIPPTYRDNYEGYRSSQIRVRKTPAPSELGNTKPMDYDLRFIDHFKPLKNRHAEVDD